MNIKSLSNAIPAQSVADLNAQTQTATARSSSVPPPQAAATASISKPGELFAKLQQLQTQDPEKFKTVLSQISDQLKSNAQAAGGTQGAFLNKMADDFAQAAQSGNLSALQPPQGPREHAGGGSVHHHHKHGEAGAGGGMASALSGILDTVNQALSASANATSSTETEATASTTTAST